MIARELRLRHHYDFDRVRSQGRSWSPHAIVLIVLPNDRGHNRYGFAVGKRIGKAVERNRAKRLLREAIRQRHPDMKQGYDLLLIARNSFRPDISLADVSEQLGSLLRRAGLIEESPQ